VPLLGELGPHLTHCGRGLLHAKFHLDLSKRLATRHQRHRQTGQQSNSMAQTVLQMVTQKLKILAVKLYVEAEITGVNLAEILG